MRAQLKVLRNIAIFTAVEAGFLALWLALAGSSGAYLAAGALLAGLIVEHVLSYNFRNGRAALRFDGLPLVSLVAIAAAETLTWAGWLVLAPKSQIAAFVVLFAGLIAGHAAELNVVRGFPPFLAYVDRLKRSLDITTIESVVGVAWLRFARGGPGALAIAVLFVGLFVEHYLSGRKRVL